MEKKSGEKEYIGMPGIFGLIVFYISFIPYLMLVWAAVFGTDTFFGGDMFNRYEYGFNAVAYMGMVLSLMIPVIPVCLIYQILFGLLYIRRRPREIKRPAVVYTAVFAALILVPCLVYSGRELVYYMRSVPEIRASLSGEYGERIAKECKIKLDDMTDEEFEVYSPVLPEGEAFSVSRSRDGGFDDHGNLLLAFENSNEGFREDLNSYLDEKYGLPDNMHIDAGCTGIGFGDYRYGDDTAALIPTAEYTVDRIYVNVDDADQESLRSLLVSIWKEECPKFRDSLGNSIVIIVYADGQAVAHLQITMPIPENNNLPVGSIGALDAGKTQYGIIDEAFFI